MLLLQELLLVFDEFVIYKEVYCFHLVEKFYLILQTLQGLKVPIH